MTLDHLDYCKTLAIHHYNLHIAVQTYIFYLRTRFHHQEMTQSDKEKPEKYSEKN